MLVIIGSRRHWDAKIAGVWSRHFLPLDHVRRNPEQVARTAACIALHRILSSGAKGIRRRQLLPSALRHALIDRRIHLSSAHSLALSHALHVLLDHALDRGMLHEHLHDALHPATTTKHVR